MLSERDLEALIIRCLLQNPNYNNVQVKLWMDVDAKCNYFKYDAENFDLHVDVVRLEMEDW